MLRDRRLLAVLAAEVVSGLGSNMTFLALPWFVLVTSGSPTRMGLVLAAELIPIAVLGIPSGSVVTRLGARTTMLVSDVARAPIIAAIPALHAAGVLTFPLLVVLVALTGVFSGPYFASQRLILPELLGDEEATVAGANSIIEGAQRFNLFLGPAAAGVLIGAIGAANVLYVDAATFLASFVLVAALVPWRPPIPSGDSGGVLAGLGFVAADPLLGPTMVTVVVSNMLGQAYFAALPVLAYEEFGRSSRVAGLFYAASGIGSLVGAVVAFRLVRRARPLRMAATGTFVGSLPRWLLILPLPAAGVAGAVASAAFWNPITNSPMISVMTVRTPPALRAKVLSAVITFATVAGPLGLVAVGPLLGAIGPRTVFFVIASGMTASALFFVGVALRADRREAANLVDASRSEMIVSETNAS